MAIRSLRLLSLLAAVAAAFRNTSPFFLLSTSDISDPSQDPARLVSATSLNARISAAVQKCPSEAYFVIQQPGVSALDFSGPPAAPYLRTWLNSTQDRSLSALIVPEVVGELDAEYIAKQIEAKCKATPVTVDVSTGSIPNESISPRIVKVTFNPITSNDPATRLAELNDHDSFLHAVVTTLGGEKYTILYTSTPPTNPHVPKPPAYEMDSKYEAVLHEDLRRDLMAHEANETVDSDLPLFDTYQFLSPGIFMGLFISILLFLILYVGITAVSSLKVSYFAFSKEMGPTAQKKQ